MRLQPHILQLTALAAVLAVSCTKTERLPDGARDRHAISFTAAVGSQGTKALIEGNAFPESSSFATLAWWLEEGSWDDDMDKAQPYIPLGSDAGSRSVVSYDEAGECWSTAIPYYWPSHGSLTFFSFHPHDMNDVTFDMTDGLVIRDRDIAGKNDQQKDIMIAEAAKDRTANSAPGADGNPTAYTGVPTIFHHTLSRLTGFSIRTDDDYSAANDPSGTKFSLTLNSIKIKDVFVKGSYRSGIDPPDTGTWYDFSGPADYEWYDEDDYEDEDAFVIGYHDSTDEAAVPDRHIRITDGESDSYAGSVLIMPQRFNDPAYSGNHSACIEVTYTVTYSFPGESKETKRRIVRSISLAQIHKDQDSSWPPGKDISYHLTIGMDKITWNPSVEDRDSETHGIIIN